MDSASRWPGVLTTLRAMGRRVTALVILVAALVVALPLADDVWLWLVYEPGELQVMGWERARVLGVYDQMVHRRSPMEMAPMTVHAKVRDWLPGRAEVVPDQVCPACAGGHHTRCLSRSAAARRSSIAVMDDGRSRPVPEFRCICTDRFHP